MTQVDNLKPYLVCIIAYDCRDTMDYGDAGTFEGFWTGEIDTWGKRTIRTIDGSTHYLFDHEIIYVGLQGQ